MSLLLKSLSKVSGLKQFAPFILRASDTGSAVPAINGTRHGVVILRPHNRAAISGAVSPYFVQPFTPVAVHYLTPLNRFSSLENPCSLIALPQYGQMSDCSPFHISQEEHTKPDPTLIPLL